VYVSIRRWNYLEFPNICHKLKVANRSLSRRKRQWLSLIRNEKLTCPVTKLKVYEVRLDVNNHMSGTVSYHYNFYSKCGKMFTVDHIHPISKGGSKMNINNLQPMIDIHNWEKADKILQNENRVL